MGRSDFTDDLGPQAAIWWPKRSRMFKVFLKMLIESMLKVPWQLRPCHQTAAWSLEPLDLTQMLQQQFRLHGIASCAFPMQAAYTNEEICCNKVSHLQLPAQLLLLPGH